MGFDRKRAGKGRDKRDGFGDESYDGYRAPSPYQSDFGGGRSGGGGGFGGGGGGGGFGAPRRGPGGPPMPAQVIGSGKGIVKFFNGQKGFGFIQVDDRPDDVFVHISAVEQAGLAGLAEGQPLEFQLVERGGKVSATDLVIDGEPIKLSSNQSSVSLYNPGRRIKLDAAGFDLGSSLAIFDARSNGSILEQLPAGLDINLSTSERVLVLRPSGSLSTEAGVNGPLELRRPPDPHPNQGNIHTTTTR